MDHLYPNLEDKCRSEGLCPICMMEMELTPKFSCDNNHILCHRCKPYYFACPKCHSPINTEIAPPEVNSYNSPPPVHFMPHPMPQPRTGYPTSMPMPMPTAPVTDDFLHQEKKSWYPPVPLEEQELIPCAYTRFGCWVKFPEHLRDIHESRCQFQNFEDPNDYPSDEEDLSECAYKSAGCNIKIPEWKIKAHEDDCPYKGRFEAMEEMRSAMEKTKLQEEEPCDPDAIVECKFREEGCMVKMPFRRKKIHEEKCNYRTSDDEEEEDEEEEEEEERYQDPEEQVDCKWAQYGCKVRPKFCRKETHEEKCNYKMENCSFKHYGCPATFEPSKRFAHERTCHYAS